MATKKKETKKAGYKLLKVKEETHYNIKLKAAKKGKTIGGLLDDFGASK